MDPIEDKLNPDKKNLKENSSFVKAFHQENALKTEEMDLEESINVAKEKMKRLFDNCFEDNSEITVDRSLLEQIFTETVGEHFGQEEKKHYEKDLSVWADKTKHLRSEQIRLNKLTYGLKKQVEDSKHIIKKLIDEKVMINKGTPQKKLYTVPSKRVTRSVEMQVCLVGSMNVGTKPVAENSKVGSTNITSDETSPKKGVNEKQAVEDSIVENKSQKKAESGQLEKGNKNLENKECDKSQDKLQPLPEKQPAAVMNKHAIGSSNTTSVEKSNLINSFCNLPRFPPAPKYPPNVVKPPAPTLQIGRKDNSGKQGIMLSWTFSMPTKPDNIEEYQLFAFQERKSTDKATKNTDMWKKVGDIKALPLPMACFLTQFVEGQTYHFIVRAIDKNKVIGDFSTPSSILLQKVVPSEVPSASNIIKEKND